MLQPDTIHKPGTVAPDLSGMTLVIAEDDQYSFEYLKQIFRSTGAEIVHAKDGIQLMKVLDQQMPDLVMLDVHMPEMNGYECLDEMRARGIRTKVIVQTASTLHEDRERIMKAGADSYICKPIRKNELFMLVHSVLNRKQP